MSRNRTVIVLCVLMVFPAAVHAVPDVRVGEIADVAVPGEVHVSGMGLVTGLAGKGDAAGSILLQQILGQLATRFGVEVGAAEVRSRNCAVVMVDADLAVFTRTGERVDVTVSSIGDAKGIEDGVLLATILQDASGTARAVAQGRLETASGSRGQLTARVSTGATVQLDVAAAPGAVGTVTLSLRNPDYAGARLLARSVAAAIPGVKVGVRDEAHVEIEVPADRRADVAGLIAEIESVRVTPEPSARVVVDSARGVVVIGENVRIGRVAVAYRKLSVSVGPVRSPQGGESTFLLEEAATVADLVAMLQNLELTSDDIIGILQAIDEAGALYGDLVVM